MNSPAEFSLPPTLNGVLALGLAFHEARLAAEGAGLKECSTTICIAKYPYRTWAKAIFTS